MNFLFVGSLEYRKGLKEIILSYKNFIKNSNSCAKLNIVGQFQDPNYEIEVMELVKDSIKSDSITFLGKLNRDQISNIYNGSDVLIMNSFAEGLPVVLLESLHNGLAIITTPVGAIPEILGDTVNALFTDNSEDLIGLENNLHILNKNRSILLKLKNNNKILSEKFTLNNFLSEFNNLINQIQ